MGIPASAELFYGYKLTDEQRAYLESIYNNQLTILNSKAGTGKTFVAVGAAKILGKPLVYTFSPVLDNLGFLPGDVEEKTEEYKQPLKDALIEIGENPQKVIESKNNMDNMKNGNTWVQAIPHTYLRGTNIKGKTVIIDEAQNFTRGDLKKLLTRIHDDCTVVMIGHHSQCDLPVPEKSGFKPYIDLFEKEPYCGVLELTRNFRGRLAAKADELEWT